MCTRTLNLGHTVAEVIFGVLKLLQAAPIVSVHVANNEVLGGLDTSNCSTGFGYAPGNLGTRIESP